MLKSLKTIEKFGLVMKAVIENVTKKFGKVVAVNNVSLKIESGEFVVLLGPSGCGKTTLLRMIAGLEKLDSGDIYLDNRKVTDLEPKDRNVGMVFQNLALFPHMTVFDNIAFPLKIRGIAEGEIRKKVREVAEIIKVQHLLDRGPKELSGGEAQRVALGRTLVRDPSIFLLDEPLANVDALLRIYMRREFQRLHRTIKGTFIYVTHDQVEAMSLGSKIVVMRNGSVEQFGSPAEVFNHPANMFVGGFIGSPPMNMLEGTLAQEGKNWVFDIGGFTYPLTKRLGEYLNERTSYKIVMGIRPEDVILFRKRNPDTVEIKVDTLEHLGSDLYAGLSTKDITVISRLKPYEKITVGEKVWIQFREGGIHFFDKKSGTRLLNVEEFD